MVVDPREAHTLESRKEGDVHNSVWPGNQPAGGGREGGVTRTVSLLKISNVLLVMIHHYIRFKRIQQFSRRKL